MKKFSISQLEEVRNNPLKFIKSLKAGSLNAVKFGSRPKSIRWLDAINKYHKTQDLSIAIDDLENSFSNRANTLKNRNEVQQLISSLECYVLDHNRCGFVFLNTKYSIDIILSEKIKITGWIWLLNMTLNGGRAGFVVSRNVVNSDWQSELKYPIIQDYIANKIYGCGLEDVEVGVIDYITGQHHFKSYTKKEISNALHEINILGGHISSML